MALGALETAYISDMDTTATSKRSRAAGIEKLSSICNYFISVYVTDAGEWSAEWPSVEPAFNQLFELSRQLSQEQEKAAEFERREKLIPVYCFNQPTMVSPCMLGDPCETCAPHALCRKEPRIACKACRKGRMPVCPKAKPAPPAFMVTRTKAISMIRLELASMVDMGRCLRLTFSKVATLRGASMAINEHFLMAYADGKKWAVAVMESAGSGWLTQRAATPGQGAFCNWPRRVKWDPETQQIGPA